MRRRSRLYYLLPLASLATAMVGCGGSDDDNNNGSTPPPVDTGTKVTSGVTVNWSARGRAIGAGSTALSARISFTRPGTTSPDTSFVVNRRDDATAYTESYLTPTTVTAGGTVIKLDFFAQKSAGGTLVATVNVAVIVKDDGTLVTVEGGSLGTISAASIVKEVEVQAPATLQVQQKAQLTAIARDADGNVVAVTPGSFVFSRTSGSAATVDPDGTVTGVSPGTIEVRATADGKSSETASINVTYGSLSGIVVIDDIGGELVYSASRNRLFVTGGTSGSYANTVRGYIPATGALDQVYRLTGRLGPLAASADGNVLYVGLTDGAAYRRIDVGTGQVGGPVSIEEGGENRYPIDLDVSPTNPNLIAVSESTTDRQQQTTGISLYNNGTKLGTISRGSASIEFNAAGDKLFVYSSGNIARYSINGATFVQEDENNSLGVTGNDMLFLGGRILTSNGRVIDPATLQQVGAFPITNGTEAIGFDASTGHVFYVSAVSGNNIRIETFDLATFALLDTKEIPSLPGTPRDVVVLSPTKLAVATDENAYVLDLTKL